MSTESLPHVARLYRYPVKGLSPEPMDRVVLEVDGAVPFDRAYAIENGPGRFNPAEPTHLPKSNFLMLMRDERLATLETRLEPDSETLVVLRQGKQVARGDLRTRIGRQMIEQFLAAYMADELRGPPPSRVRPHGAVRRDQCRPGERGARHGDPGQAAAHLGAFGFRSLRESERRRSNCGRRFRFRYVAN